MYFSLEFVFKREIRACQKGDVSAIGLRWVARVHPAKIEVCFVFSLEQKKKREAVASIRHSYIDSSLISGVP